MTKLVLYLFLVQFLGANAQVQGSLRLVGTNSPNVGRLEVYINGHWGTVCDDSWDYNDARVACRQLGYTGVMTPLTSSFSYSSSQRIWLDNVRCTGSESKLIYCRHNGYGNEDCSHSEDVGIYCSTAQPDVYPRLVWIILIPLVCGLIVLCVLCVPCVVAYCLYRKKKPRASPVPGNPGAVRYTTSDEQPRVGYPTLPSTDQEGEVQINYHSGDSVIRVDTTVCPGLVVMDQPQECIESPPSSIQQD